jgi:hypothetical protein
VKIILAVAIGANGKYGASEAHPEAFDGLKRYVQEGDEGMLVDVYKITVDLPKPGQDRDVPMDVALVGGPGDLPMQPFKAEKVAASV